MNTGASEKSVGLALGGGGARGLVHVLVLQMLDEYGIRPKVVSGASIGAIIGALYCSGHSGDEIHHYVEEHLKLSGTREDWREDSRKMMEMVRLLDLDFRGTGIIKGERFSHFLYDLLEGELFSDLEIPLRITATDFWDSSPVVFDQGPVLAAVIASMSVPGVFSPAQIDGRILIDGACTNPVPWDLLDNCDILIGVNALGRGQQPDPPKPPRAARSVLETFDIMQRGILAEKMKGSPPDILVDPPITGVGLLDFRKAADVYRQSAAEMERLRRFIDERF